MAVVMPGQFGYWLSMYAQIEKAMELTTADLTVPVARASLDRGGYALDEWAVEPGAMPLFVQTDRTDPNRPVYNIVDSRFESLGRASMATDPRHRYSVDNSGRILYQPQGIANPPADWFKGNHASLTGGGNVTITADSFIWHPNPAEVTNTVDGRWEPMYFGFGFHLDKHHPVPTLDDSGIGGRVYLVADNHARVYVNGTYIGSTVNGTAGYQQVSELMVPANVLRPGDNVLTVEVSNAGGGTYATNPAGVSIVAELGGIQGLGGGYGGVTITTRPDEQDSWSVSRRSPNGFAGAIDFEMRDAGSTAFRTDSINKLQAVMGTLTSLLASANEFDYQKFSAIR